MRQVKKISRRKAALCTMLGCTLMLQSALVSAAAEDPTGSTVLDQVVVTANRVPTKLSEAAANVTVVTREEIESNNSKTIADVLQNVNGVILSGKGAAGSEQAVMLNGDSRVLVMIDGRRMNLSKLAGHTAATYDLNSFITLDNIERIEILKGAGSAQFGSDAVGGVINIITRKGTKNQTTLDISQGAWGTGNYNLTNSGSQNGWSWFLTAGKSHQNSMTYKNAKTGNMAEMPNSQYDQNNLTFRLDRQLNDSSSLTFNFEHADDNKGQPGSIYYANWSGTLLGPDTRSYLNTLSNNLALSYNYKMKAEVPAHFRVYQNYFQYDYHDYGHTNIDTRHLKNERDIGLDWQDGWRLDKNNVLTAGLEWRKSTVSDPEVYDSQDKEVTTVGAYLEDRLKLSSRWTFVPGLRYDNHSMFGGHFTPRATLNYKPDADTDIYVSWSEVFRAPTTDDLFWNQPSYGMIGNPNLKPETGHTTSLGINRKLGKNASLSASYFYSELKDAISWVNIVSGTYQPQNVDQMKKYGFDITAQTALSPEWKLSAGYSWLKREIKDQYHTDWYNDANNPLPNGYHLGIDYTKKFWDVGLTLIGVSGRETTKFSSSTYWLLNLSANYQINKNAKLYFKWNNITNQAYESWGDSTTGSYPMPASNWQIGVKYSF